ncbi:MAG: glycoside hydrolase family 127 protein [Bacteroidales bacterium]|nr:glycoside hydrolase family 127 protein [Candidatus Sodaliphilus aphodohippi]
MKKLGILVAMLMLVATVAWSQCYTFNRQPLQVKPYAELPLGSIKAKGWLQEMLHRQVTGATSQMDKLYPQVMGERNGWLGGDGDQWERGPYWIDGLLPLAYITGNKELQKKVQPWIEWTLDSQREDGYFGPSKDYEYEPGLQRNNSADWWPRMVVLKIMQQYYQATGDKRVIDFMTRYFRYQLSKLPEQKLGNWTFWAEYRECDNLQAVYWLYNITGDSFLLDLGKLLHKQGYDFEHMFLHSDYLSRFRSIHCVNLAQGLKEPVIYWQQSGNPNHLKAVKKGLADNRHFNGQIQGMYGGDEGLHGNNPTQGSELCSAVELMFSLEKMIEITGDVEYSDYLERVAYNALPTQITDDFMAKQYFQQANQVMITRNERNFYEGASHDGTDIIFGTLTGYPCCFSNMHQGWPKFTQSLWMATIDEGLAAVAYAPSEVTAKVSGDTEVNIVEDTYYPMDDQITFTVNIKGKKNVRFPLKLRIPKWCSQPQIKVNGETIAINAENGVAILRREWKNGDKVELTLPMQVTTSRWYEHSIGVERGPLVYALKMNEKWERVDFDEEDRADFGESYWKVTSDSKWNYGIVSVPRDKVQECFKVSIDKKKQQSLYPWNLENAPISIEVDAQEIPSWTLYNKMAGPMPCYPQYSDRPVEKITLIPYGCTTLRISEFPIVFE